ncbi:MAG TPA: hypothetical protein VH913_06800 [Hyphomicrobiaceae bacterium]|jgi:hypothetical protein
MNKMMMLGAGLLAVALQVPDRALAAMKGSERGVIAIIKPADKQLGGPDTKSKQGSRRRLPYVEQKHKTK